MVKRKLKTRDDLGGDNGFDTSIGWIENDEGTVHCECGPYNLSVDIFLFNTGRV